VHGAAWYARTLGGLLAAGACEGRAALPGLLGRGIEQVSRMCAGACDLRHPATPSATAILAGKRGGSVEHLAPCDSAPLILRRAGEPSACTDTQLEETQARLRTASAAQRRSR
jgi:hypothetical protein